ncbi:MAG TPA: hypothetical protein VM577_08650 [Anaerovoracaceae bacterium]|nr:hypothetical protein [Anaerovoracaceae bacterium]
MERKFGRSILSCLLTFILVLSVVELSGCNNTTEEQEKSADPIMNLLNQTYFFKGAPKELYFGKASSESFSDQGVTIKYLASFFDGEATYIFFDLTDAGANLFSKGSNGFDFSLGSYDFSEKTGYNDSRQYQLISYDEKTRTATICVEYIGPLQTDNLSFHLYSLNGNQKTINPDSADIDLYKMLNKTVGEFEPENEFMGTGTAFGIMDEKTGESREVEMPEFDEGNGDTVYRLIKDVLSIPVEDTEGNHVADITNIGWRNGWLHVQVNPENSIKWDVSFNLKNNKTGELIYSPFNLSFGSVPDQEELNDYCEYVFYVGDMTEENLDCSIAFINSVYRATSLKGDWEIKLSIPNALLKKLEADRAVPVNDGQLTIQRAVISPVNITLFASAKDISDEQMNWFDKIENNALSMKIIYQDGKTAKVPEVSTNSIRNQKGLLFRTVFNPENFDEITGMEVNGVLFPVEEN